MRRNSINALSKDSTSSSEPDRNPTGLSDEKFEFVEVNLDRELIQLIEKIKSCIDRLEESYTLLHGSRGKHKEDVRKLIEEIYIHFNDNTLAANEKLQRMLIALLRAYDNNSRAYRIKKRTKIKSFLSKNPKSYADILNSEGGYHHFIRLVSLILRMAFENDELRSAYSSRILKEYELIDQYSKEILKIKHPSEYGKKLSDEIRTAYEPFTPPSPPLTLHVLK